MPKIRLLPDALASQVAAGEVVERPASVVKELVENSLDSGARKIEVSVRRGGVSLIRVVDDGCGMNRTDALLSVERHATSKIRTKEDLAAIATLGFRGEALPSIASVSKFTLSTREKDALCGTAIAINGGKMMSVKDGGDAPGTQIEVRSLFFNLPARRKFLRTENTEFSHVERQVRIEAIAHPEVAFTLAHGDRTCFQVAATDRLFERIRGLAGNDLAGRLIEVPRVTRGGITVWGYIGEAGLGRSNRSQQLVFLNRRPVESPVLHYAVREGYHTALMKGQYPITFLFLEMDPRDVDVNVHPAKKEVRFHDGNGVRNVVIDVLSRVLRGAPARPFAVAATERSRPETAGVAARAVAMNPDPVLIPEREQRALRRDWLEAGARLSPATPDAPPVRISGEEEVVLPGDEVTPADSGLAERGEAAAAQQRQERVRARPDDFRIIGVLGKLYVLMEGREGLVLMDQHAAHERVLFEEMRRRMEEEGVPSQQLLMPLTIELDPRDYDLVRRNLETLQKLGIGAEEFGANTLKIDSLPTFLKSDDKNAFVNRVIEELKRESGQMSSMRLGEDMVATTVCRHAVKAHDKLRPEELAKLLEDLLECELPYCCPHGRPTLIQMAYPELERKFGRQAP